MAIVINEIEIVPEPASPPREPTEQDGQGPSDEPAVPEPEEIIRVLRLFAQRKRRLWAD
jgi:hypothetical protein